MARHAVSVRAGHEMVGRVSAVGDDAGGHKVGDVVDVGCLVGSCKRCASCGEGLEQYCENGFVATYNGPTGNPHGHTLGGSRSGNLGQSAFLSEVQ